MVANWHGAGAVAVAESLHVEIMTMRQKKSQLERNLKAFHQWHTSSKKAIPFNPSQIIHQLGSKHLNI